MNKEPKTPVIFRMLQGECIAIFPTLAGTNDPNTCMSYMHRGQHSPCTIWLSDDAPLASKEQYEPLKRELEGLGYNLKQVRKINRQHHKIRRESLS